MGDAPSNGTTTLWKTAALILLGFVGGGVGMGAGVGLGSASPAIAQDGTASPALELYVDHEIEDRVQEVDARLEKMEKMLARVCRETVGNNSKECEL